MLNLVEGWTERIKYRLDADGSPPDLTGKTAELLLYDKHGNLYDYAGTSGVETPDSGIVYFDPSSADLIAENSRYSIRWKITDASGKVAFFPTGQPEKWVVSKP